MNRFVNQYGLWDADQCAQADQLAARFESGEFDVVRFVFPDQHGILRGKTLVASEAKAALWRGVSMTTTLFAKDTSHKTVFPVFAAGGGFAFEGMQGGADFIMVADPSTFRTLPWANKTGWVLCDPYTNRGQPFPLATRPLLRKAVAKAEALGFDLVAGLEVEFHVFRMDQEQLKLTDSGQPGTPPAVSLLSQGYQYLTELRYDRADHLMELLRSQLQALGLPLRSLEIEFGPSQFELTFGTTRGVMPADMMVLLRSAIKQVCARHGYHATFMCRPKIPNVMSSGWHLHQSLCQTGTQVNVFMPESEAQPLSPLGMQYVAGLKQHARDAALFSCPTINGYRRYRPFSLAPDRAVWACDNRAAMLRVLGRVGDPASRVENRVGEPAANPYLYLASQLLAGLDGIERRLDPGPSADAPYETPADPLPRSLDEAVHALRHSKFWREQFGDTLIDYLCHIKDAELARFNLEVSDWEQREYFDMF